MKIYKITWYGKFEVNKFDIFVKRFIKFIEKKVIYKRHKERKKPWIEIWVIEKTSSTNF
jgi:hypothetical protein